MGRDLVRVRRWVVRRMLEGRRVDAVSLAVQVPRRTCYRWVSRYGEGRTLKNLPKRPHIVHRKVTDELVDAVCEVRRLHGRSPGKVTVKLKEGGI